MIRGHSCRCMGNKIHLNDTTLDVSAGTLVRAGALVPLRLKSFTLLTVLVERAGRVVTKDELFDTVWPDVTVTEDSLTQAIRDVRSAIGDSSASLIRTVRGRGYILDLPAKAETREPTAHIALPRVVVLPFETRPHSEDLALRMEALAEDVAAALTRYKTLRVISTASAREALRQGHTKIPAAQFLQADYVIEGTAFSQDGQLLLRLSLTELASHEQVWRDTIDCTGDAILSAWNKVTARVIGYIVNGIEVEVQRPFSATPTSSITAYDHRARGLALWMSDDPSTAARCLEHFRAAVTADPNFALAWTHMAWAELAVHEYSLAPAEVLQRTLDYSRRAVELAPLDGRTHSGLGYNQAICGEFALGEANVRFGLHLNPSSVDCLFDLAVLVLLRGRPLEVLRLLDEAADLCPLRIGYDAQLRGEALFMLGRYNEAADTFQRLPSLSNRRRVMLAAMLARASRDSEAVALIEKVMSDQPDEDHIDIMRRGYVYENKSDAEHLLEAARLAFDLWKQHA